MNFAEKIKRYEKLKAERSEKLTIIIEELKPLLTLFKESELENIVIHAHAPWRDFSGNVVSGKMYDIVLKPKTFKFLKTSFLEITDELMQDLEKEVDELQKEISTMEQE